MIEFHADDFGLFERQSQRILACCQNGVLNGISIMPNSDCLPRCMRLLEPFVDNMAITVHLNLVEGRCLSIPSDIALIVNQEGVFNISFVKLLLASFSPSRKKYLNQICNEFKEQIRRVYSLCEQKPLRLDSHVHYHMVPVVFDAMIQAIEEERFPVSYIRIPKEHLCDYLSMRALSGVKPINIIKAIVLNILAWRNLHKHRIVLGKMEKKIFYGVVYSGNMCYQNVRKIMKRCKKRVQNGESIEILFHPGSVLEADDQEKLTSADDLHFLTHVSRKAEADALIQLKGKICT